MKVLRQEIEAPEIRFSRSEAEKETSKIRPTDEETKALGDGLTGWR